MCTERMNSDIHTFFFPQSIIVSTLEEKAEIGQGKNSNSSINSPNHL